MTIEVLLAFVAATALLALTPGPSMSLIIANGASYGARAGLLNVAGNSLGLGILVAAVVLGMSSAMALVAEWFDWVRWIGAAYLVWLGVSKLRRVLASNALPPEMPASGKRWFWQGFAVALSNPKVLLFLGAFFPQFINVSAPVGAQLMILGIAFIVTLTVIDSGMALLAGRARTWLTASRWRLMDGVTGSLLIAGGVWLAVQKRA